ncbi:Peptidoglycan-binding LysM [Ruegeria sp. TM1040]|uniref:LysM peptidoglycan-binding domain-containing protein n=1 Tax=Ruegeria sp. (strain TM1040) TaxID=292414 RepID=UPI000046271C|nr:LysM peptidoglycan-binding domain-containing protein [Ruegeria sp. TM1040]ABF63712.1 Peptidoglycan-binding LysM [Ruegeria sp. TM1040]
MTKTSGIGAGASLAIGTVATVVVVGGGVFLARGGILGEGARSMVEQQLVALGLAAPPAPEVVPVKPVVTQPQTADPETRVVEPEPTPEATAGETVETQQDAPTAEPAFVLQAPKLEIARFEPDGSGIVAASAQAGVEVQVLLDDEVLDTQTVPAAGEFVSFVTIDLSDKPRLLTLLARHNGQELASEDSFILAPMPAPAAPEPQVDQLAAAQTDSDIAAPEEEPIELAEATETADPNVADQATDAPDPDAPGDGAAEGSTTVTAQSEEVALADVAVDSTDPDAEGDASSTESAASGAADNGVATDMAAVENTGDQLPDAASEAVSEASPEAVDPSVDVAEATSALPETEVTAEDAPAAEAPEETVETAALEQAIDDESARESSEDSVPAPEPEVAAVADTSEPPAPDTTPAPQSPVEVAEAVDTPEVPSSKTDTMAAVEEVQQPQPQDPDTESPSGEAAPAPQATSSVAVLRAGRDGVTLVQPAAPAAPELVGKVALDTISYTETGDVQLAGRARPEALVRVYLDNSPVAELAAASDGQWSGSLTSVAPGIYTLRLDEIDPVDGIVLSRLETPFKREAPEVLQPAVTADQAPDQAAPVVRAVTVQEGDTLWAISQQRYGSGFLYVRVFEANKGDIRDPDLIYPGQIFTLPE